MMATKGHAKRTTVESEGTGTALPYTRSLSAQITRQRLRSWGALAPRRKQRLAMLLLQLREAADETQVALAQAARDDGVEDVGARAVYDLEAMRDLKVATKRTRVNFLIVSYVLMRYGKTLDEAWRYMTAEEGPAFDTTLSPREAAQAEADDLAETYLTWVQTNPAKARELREYAVYLASKP